LRIEPLVPDRWWKSVKTLKVLSALVLAVAFAALGAPAAGAATSLVASDPVPRQELAVAPSGVSLSFDHVIDDGSAKILVLDTSGAHVGVGDVEYWGSTISMQLVNELPNGTYTVQYRVPDAAGVPEGGAFQFAVGSGTWTDPLPGAEWHGEAEQPPGMANPDPYETGAPATSQPTEPQVEEVTPTPSATATATTPPQTPTTSPESTPTVAPTEPASGAGLWPWLVGGAIVAATAVLGGWLVVRNRRAG
jgi:methionine-rich copper-binding protein CopC